jgi:putative addiction module component (TIGR02574 family)
MSSSLEAIYMFARKLPEHERLELAARLLDTLPQESSNLSLEDDSLVEELERRFADAEGSVPWPELRDEK